MSSWAVAYLLGSAMAKPRCIDRRGHSVELEPGTYHWCACGRSRHQPFCDGSHAGTGIEPVQLELTETKRIKLCLCKRSGHPPRCDGSHNRIGAEEVDGPMPE